MYPNSEITSHRNKNRLLVGCLSTVIGGPLMCCCLLGMFNFVLPAIGQADARQFPVILTVGGLAVFGLLLLIALGGTAVYMRGRNFPGLSTPGEGVDQDKKVANIRQISLLVLAFGLPLCFIMVGLTAYLMAVRLG